MFAFSTGVAGMAITDVTRAKPREIKSSFMMLIFFPKLVRMEMRAFSLELMEKEKKRISTLFYNFLWVNRIKPE
jgi:hypothetical protein